MNITAQRIYDYIIAYIGQHTYGPTIREVADQIGCSTSNAHRHVDKLARVGKIIKTRRRARSIRLPASAVLADLLDEARDGDTQHATRNTE